MLPCVPLQIKPLASVGLSEETRLIYHLHGQAFRDFVNESKPIRLLRTEYSLEEESNTHMTCYVSIFPEKPGKTHWLLEIPNRKSVFVVIKLESCQFSIVQLYLDFDQDSRGNSKTIQEVLACTVELSQIEVLVIACPCTWLTDYESDHVLNLIYQGFFTCLSTLALHPELYTDKKLRKMVGISARRADPWYEILSEQFSSVV